jgi:hypothetical protein
MKTIQLKTTEEVVIQNNQQIKTEIKTIELLKVALNSPVQGGYTVSDMAQRIKILDNIEKADKANSTEFQLEDTDYQALATLVRDTKWSVISRTIVNFVNEFDK